MPLKPGTLDDFGASMAEAIEAQLNDGLLADGLPGLPNDPASDVRDRRRLFVAIARGVVKYLRDNQASIVIHYTDSTVVRTTTPTISTTGI